MTISAILQRKGREVVALAADATVREAVALLAGRRIGAIPVTDGGAVTGIFSERDVIYNLASHGAAVLDWPVERVMTAPAITIEPAVSVLAALSQMTRRRIRHLPVVDGGSLIGIVSIGDLVKFQSNEQSVQIQFLTEYISG